MIFSTIKKDTFQRNCTHSYDKGNDMVRSIAEIRVIRFFELKTDPLVFFWSRRGCCQRHHKCDSTIQKVKDRKLQTLLQGFPIWNSRLFRKIIKERHLWTNCDLECVIEFQKRGFLHANILIILWTCVGNWCLYFSQNSKPERRPWVV